MSRYIETLFRNKWRITIPALLLLLVGPALAVIQPKKYNVAATIWTETSAYLDVQLSKNPYLTPATIHANRFDELISTYTFARTIVDQTPIGKTGTELEKETLVDLIHKGLAITSSGDHIIRIRFSHPNATVALAVVQVGIAEYSRVTAESSNMQASEAIAFYQERVKTYEETVLPRSQKAVSDYLDTHPDLRRTIRDGGPVDPNFALIQKQFELDQDQRDRFVAKLEEIQTRSQAANTNQDASFRIMDTPAVIDGGGLSKKSLIIFAAVSVGLSMGYILLFLGLATELDRTMRSAADVRHKLQIPVLDVIPDYAPKETRRSARTRKAPRVVTPAQQPSRA